MAAKHELDAHKSLSKWKVDVQSHDMTSAPIASATCNHKECFVLPLGIENETLLREKLNMLHNFSQNFKIVINYAFVTILICPRLKYSLIMSTWNTLLYVHIRTMERNVIPEISSTNSRWKNVFDSPLLLPLLLLLSLSEESSSTPSSPRTSRTGERFNSSLSSSCSPWFWFERLACDRNFLPVASSFT